ncbi:FAD-dependent oxidoreductase [Egicoccus sp. AB-alg6-2]|uniref:FAD-dependent oxidoreductase n=1 Tax=Egicoccus sp. AB-alg6-2 TaxID=3242692 RepID=UPI00359E1251
MDVLVHGATAGGVVAAVAAARRGARVVLTDPTTHVGGMVTGGLTRSDVERQEHVIGGFARDFFVEVGARYGDEHRWRFEPSAADELLRSWLDVPEIELVPSWRLADVVGRNGGIDEVVGADGRSFRATTYVDASYEGDLLAMAGVSHDIGRDGRDRYGESLAGRIELLPNPHQFLVPVSAVDDDGALLPGIHAYDEIGDTGQGDGKLQSYCYRMCLTDDPDLRVDIPAPEGYDPATFELARRYLDALGEDATLRHFMGIGAVPNAKADINSGGPVSTSLLGGSFDYPRADAQRRREIERAHRDWAQGLLYFLGNDPSVPPVVRRQMAAYGLPGDEFVDNDHWPPQLYVRDARRMRGEFVLTQHDLQGRTGPVDDAIGMGGYNIDIREVQWVAAPVYRFPDVFPEAMTEGYLSVPVDPYPIPYRTMLPRPDECTNLLVSACVSASHVAFASFRMEPQFMIAGQAAGTAAALASGIDGRVHDVDVSELQRCLREDGQILEARGA